MTTFVRLDSLLRDQCFDTPGENSENLRIYARFMALVENVMVVLSDLRDNSCCIFPGLFGRSLGIMHESSGDSIWEDEILRLMDSGEREAKFLAELRFISYLRRLPRHLRQRHYLVTRLRFRPGDGDGVEVLHRMHYVYDAESDAIRYSVCVYQPLVGDLGARSIVVDSVTGCREELTASDDGQILSRRERQVLSLIDSGQTSREIASMLSISLHTVSRHRQAILAKLNVKNSVEACRVAKMLKII